MALHLLSPGRLARALAADAVSPREQAMYLVAGAVAWLIPVYLYIFPVFLSAEGWWRQALWIGEFAMLVAVNAAGVHYCLRQCRHRPERHFLVDFGCLAAPASILALAVSWGGYHLALAAFAAAVQRGFEMRPALFEHLHDVGVYLVVVGQVAAMYFIIGANMRRASHLRMGASL